MAATPAALQREGVRGAPTRGRAAGGAAGGAVRGAGSPAAACGAANGGRAGRQLLGCTSAAAPAALAPLQTERRPTPHCARCRRWQMRTMR